MRTDSEAVKTVRQQGITDPLGLPNVEDQPPADGTPAFGLERRNPPVGCILLFGGDVQGAYTDRPTQ